MPVEADFVIGSWIFRILAPIGAMATFIHLQHTAKDPVLSEKLAGVMPATESVCPFCGVPLMVGSETYCPNCAVFRV
jgi:hypothetical protein